MHIRDILNVELPKISQYVDSRLIDKIILGFEEYKRKSSISDFKNETNQKENLLVYILENINNLYIQFEQVNLKHNEFRKKFSKAQSEDEKQNIILSYGALNGFENSVSEDLFALDRWMYDDAVDERFEKVKSEIVKELKFNINRSGVVFFLIVSIMNSKDGLNFWNKIGFIDSFKPLLTITINKNLLNESLSAISKALSSIKNKDERKELIDEQEMKFIYRLSLEFHQDVWTQSAALELLYAFSIDSFLSASNRRLVSPKGKDDMFVRHRIFQILSNSQIDENFYPILDLGVNDTSAYVKQSLLKSFISFNDEYCFILLEKLLFNDDDDSVKAQALDTLNQLKITSEQYTEIIIRFLDENFSFYILRYAMDNIYLYIKNSNPEQKMSRLLLGIKKISMENNDKRLRVFACEYIEKINSILVEKSDSELKYLKNDILLLPEGSSLSIDKSLSKKDGFYRFLSSLTIDNFPLEFKQGIFKDKIYKGDKITQKFWRFWYETKFTSSDKREGYDHTQGREYRGESIFLSNKLAEVTPTKVIGEPVHIASDAGWMGYLPLPSHILYAVSKSIFGKNSITLYSSVGKTTITIDMFYFKRIFMLVWTNFNFSELANERTDVIFENKEKNSYYKYLYKMGIKLEFQSYNKESDKTFLEYFKKDTDV